MSLTLACGVTEGAAGPRRTTTSSCVSCHERCAAAEGDPDRPCAVCGRA